MQAKSVKWLATSLAGLLLLGACAAEVNKMVPQPKSVQKERVVKKGDYATIFSQAVDILFVIDDSGSMSTYQDRLAKELDLFLAELGQLKYLDYHIGVITTTYEEDPAAVSWGGVLNGTTKVVTPKTVDGLDILRKNMKVGTNGSAIEKVFDPMTEAFSTARRNKENQGFYRQHAYLAVIFLTDAEDQSENYDPFQAFDFLRKLKGGDISKVMAYGAYLPVRLGSTPSGGCSRDMGLPYRLEKFLGLFNPRYEEISFSLCDSKYGAQLAKLTKDIVARISGTVLLQRLPIESTIRVTYGSQVIPQDEKRGWTYDPVRVALIFGPDVELGAEPEGTEVQVEFDSYSVQEI